MYTQFSPEISKLVVHQTHNFGAIKRNFKDRFEYGAIYPWP